MRGSAWLVCGFALWVASASQADQRGTTRRDAPREGREWAEGKFDCMRDFVVVSRGNPTILLQSPPIQDELGVTATQLQDVRALEKATIAKRVQDLNQIMNRETDASLAELGALREREQWVAIRTKILTREQAKRLWEIALQAAGPLAVCWPEVQDGLRLSYDQRLQVEQIWSGYFEAYLSRSVGFTEVLYGRKSESIEDMLNRQRNPRRREPVTTDPQAVSDNVRNKGHELDRLHDEFEANRLAAERAISRILTRRQKDRFNKMLGEPFDAEPFSQIGSGNWSPEDVARYREKHPADPGREATSDVNRVSDADASDRDSKPDRSTRSKE